MSSTCCMLAIRKCQQRCFSTQSSPDNVTKLTSNELASLQTKLLHEASYLTRTLYRKCLQSVNLLAKGNARDEDDFSAREIRERNQFIDNDGGGTSRVDMERISMAPPVNRLNELASRANYYRAFSRENFDGHWNLLGEHGFHIGTQGNMTHGLGGPGGGQQRWNQYQGGHHHLGGQMSAQYQGSAEGSGNGSGNNDVVHYMWREEQVEQFVYLIKSGEEKRQWILNDYDFEDPYNSPKGAWSQELEDRLRDFEAQSNVLVKEMYRRNGWIHSSDYSEKQAEDDFFSDSDSDDS